MLKKARQKKYFNQVWRSMRAQLSAFYDTDNPEALHRFRIQVKKIRALLLFLQDDSIGKNGARRLKPLLSVFKHAGRIRSAHINLQLIGKYQLRNLDFKQEQEIVVTTETALFYAKRGVYIKTVRQTRDTFSGGFQDMSDKIVLDLYKKHLKQLARFFAKFDAPIDKLHDNRKKIKDLLYLYAVLPDSLAGKLNLNTAYLDRLQDAIGKWHDLVMVVELLKREGYADKKKMAGLDRQQRRMRIAVNLLADDFGKKAVN